MQGNALVCCAPTGHPKLAQGSAQDQHRGHIIGPTGHHPSAQGLALAWYAMPRWAIHGCPQPGKGRRHKRSRRAVE